MSLPGITAPPGTPVFLASGHGIVEDSVFARIKSATGHTRLKRVRAVPERQVSVSWILEAAQLATVEDWYENTLKAGSLQFAARVANQGPGLLWWTARWVEIQYELLPFGRARVSGTLFLTGDGSVEGPELGGLSMEVGIDLRDVRSSIVLPTGLAMEVSIRLVQPLLLSMEVEVTLLSVYAEMLLKEDGDALLLESGEYILLE